MTTGVGCGTQLNGPTRNFRVWGTRETCAMESKYPTAQLCFAPKAP